MDEILQGSGQKIKVNDTLALIFYMIGDWISKSPLCNFRFGGIAYQKLMLWSLDLDKKEKIWKSVK